MSRKLEGQVAIVTGAGRGIGREVALALAREGAAVAVISRTAEQLDETVRLIEEAAGRVLAMAGDVSESGTFERVVAEAETRFGAVDLLVNNAGVNTPMGRSWEIDLEVWRQTQEINVTAPFRGMRAVLPGMIERGHGRIINISTGAVLQPQRWSSAYSISKVALNRLTESFALELEGTGVFVFNLDPGRVHTEMADQVDRWRASQDWLPKTTPGGYIPGDAPAAACVLLASGEADVLQGRFLSVQHDLLKLIQEAGRIQEHGLHRLTVRLLD